MSIIKKHLEEARKIINEDILAEQTNEDGSFGEFANPAACAITEIDNAVTELEKREFPERIV